MPKKLPNAPLAAQALEEKVDAGGGSVWMLQRLDAV